MIYLKIENNQIAATSSTVKEGFESYEASNEYDVLVNPAKYELRNSLWQEKWIYTARPIKIRLTDEQNTNLMTAYPELGMWRKIQGLPVEKVIFDGESGADTYLSEWYDITMGEDVFTVEMIQGILNSFGAIIINR